MRGIAETGAAPSAAAVQPVPCVIELTVVVGTALAQPAGTDSPPTAAASPRPAVIAPPPTELTREPSAASPPASGVTASAATTSARGAAARVCPSETATGMAVITNHAEVFTA